MPYSAKEIDPHELFGVVNNEMYAVDIDISEQIALNFSLCEMLESTDRFSSEIDAKLRELLYNAIALLNIQARLLTGLKNDTDTVANKLMAMAHNSDEHREENKKK